MKKWEYKIINSHSFKKVGILKDFAVADVESQLNQLGQQGWQIVHFDCKFKVKEIETFTAVVKREAASASTSPPEPVE
jgi:hypothetical protein